MSNTKILLVEDDAGFGPLLRDFLIMHEYDVTLCRNGQEGWNAFQQESFELCILDVMMPVKDGFTLAEEIKQANPAMPVIFLTAKTLKEDLVKGYRIGADDYITKPFDSEILLLKIQAILKRGQETAPEKKQNYTIGNYTYRSDLRELTGANGSVQTLSPKEGDLLEMLCQYEGRVMPRSRALKEIWKNDDYFTGRSMDVYITKLRKYLAEDPRIEIRNIHSEGFIMQVKEA